MNLRKKRTYLAIIALGLAAVAVDRVWLREEGRGATPRRASATTTPTPDAGGTPPGLSKPPEEQPFGAEWTPPAVYRFPETWGELTPEGESTARDPFQAGADFAELPPGDGQHPGDGGRSGTGPSGPLFEAAHRLEAVVVSPLSRWAVIDGRIMAVNDVLDGHVLTRIDATEVVFQGPTGSVVLKLPQENLDGG